jgi:hypothetical protein
LYTVSCIKKILESNPDARILIVSYFSDVYLTKKAACLENENSFIKLFKANSTNHDIKCIIKTNNGMQVARTIKAFKNGDFKILYLNTYLYGSGLNLHFVTDMILKDNMPFNIFKQALGRAQRMPRLSNLNVHISSESNKKHFEKLFNIHLNF